MANFLPADDGYAPGDSVKGNPVRTVPGDASIFRQGGVKNVPILGVLGIGVLIYVLEHRRLHRRR